MHNKLNIDTFVHGDTMIEDYSGGAWSLEDIEDDKARIMMEEGVFFRPNSNILYHELLTQEKEDRKYCLTQIDKNDVHHSFKNLSFEELMLKIQDLQFDLRENDEGYLTIYDMADGITFEQYHDGIIAESLQD